MTNLFFSVVLTCLAYSLTEARPASPPTNVRLIGGDLPEFCHGIPCPPYKVLKTTAAYEVRHYSETTWIMTNVSSSNFEVAVAKAFVPLYGYLQGKNEAGVQLDMAKPVISRITPTDSSFSAMEKNYTFLFYLPGLSQESAPAPTDEKVIVVTSPEQKFYVGVFGGYATGGSILNAALKLALALKTDKIEYDTKEFFFGLYDSPTRVFGRHNEVFFMPASDADTMQIIA